MTDNEALMVQRALGELTQAIRGVQEQVATVVRGIETATSQGNQAMQQLAALKVGHEELAKGQDVLFAKVDRLEEQGAGLKTKVAIIGSAIGGAVAWVSNNVKIGS